jgi:hypothetical protein
VLDESIATVRNLMPMFDDAAMKETWSLVANGREVLAQPRGESFAISCPATGIRIAANSANTCDCLTLPSRQAGGRAAMNLRASCKRPTRPSFQ